jgi:outer membrane protein
MARELIHLNSIMVLQKMKIRICLLSIILTLCWYGASGQVGKWTLEECISYAVTNNINLQRQKLQTESYETNLLKSRMDYLPSLNFGSNAQLGFGRSIDPVTNLITFKQNVSNSYSLSANLNLFTGFATLNTNIANRFMYKAGLEAEQIAKNTVIIEILGQYYQVLYARGIEEASKMQMELSEKQYLRIIRMVETGKEALSRQYEMESRFSDDRLSYTIAHNNASQAVTNLKQMLQLSPDTEFDIMIPDLSNMPVTDADYRADSIFRIASETLPRLKAIDYELQANRKQISAAKGSLVPRISIGGAIYTGYYKVISEDAVEQMSFSDQLKNNNSQALYFSLDVPIFNNYTIGRNIKTARIRKSDTELRLELEKNNLYTEIENACLDYSRGKDEFIAAQANLEFNNKSFESVEKKFESGLVDVTDYSAAKTSLFRAEAEALRTKLQMMIRKLTLNFYTSGDYESVIFN